PDAGRLRGSAVARRRDAVRAARGFEIDVDALRRGRGSEQEGDEEDRAHAPPRPLHPTPATGTRRIARVPKMKAYATFDLYAADQPPKNRTLIRALRRFVARAAP